MSDIPNKPPKRRRMTHPIVEQLNDAIRMTRPLTEHALDMIRSANAAYLAAGFVFVDDDDAGHESAPAPATLPDVKPAQVVAAPPKKVRPKKRRRPNINTQGGLEKLRQQRIDYFKNNKPFRSWTAACADAGIRPSTANDYASDLHRDWKTKGIDYPPRWYER